MSRLEKYPKYKDSGVEWLGEIPKKWKLEKIKYIFKEKQNRNDISLPTGSISFGKIIYKNNNIPLETKKSYQVLNKEEFLINPLNLNYDLKSLRIALSKIDVVVSSGYIILQVIDKEKINNQYFNYLLYIFDILFMKTLGAGVRQTLSFRDLENCVLTFPALQEQQKIANYLNQKTAQIDKTISLKEQMIERLKERRQIIINNAVTRGIDKNTKMKDSGIEWIDEIPEGWEVKKFKYIFTFSKGLNITKENLEDEGIPCLNYGEIHSKYGFEVIPEKHNLKCVKPNYLKNNQKSFLNNGDFIFADTSEDIEGSGNFTYLNSKTRIFAGYHTVIARCQDDNFKKRYIAYLFDSINFRNQIRQQVKGVKVYSITNSILKRLLLLRPPKKTQQDIIDFIDKETAKIDKVISLQQKQIEKLKEYKTTLIDSVVTGKVRVCDD